MLKRILFFSLLTGLIAACGTETGTAEGNATSDNSSAEKVEEQVPGKQFGEPINETDAMDMSALLTKMETVDSIPAKVVGTVESVCQVKGCWMNIVSDKEGEGELFVKFKDYGFFMPLDIAGRKVIMDGYAFREVTTVDELRHYAEDEGKSAEDIAAITEPKEELKFMASGVLLLDE